MNLTDFTSVMIGAHDQRSRPRTGSFDRFIPAREMLNMAAASFKMSSPGQSESTDMGTNQDVIQEAGELQETSEMNNNCKLPKQSGMQRKVDYRQRMAILSEGVTEENILSFRPRKRSGSWSGGYRDVGVPKMQCRKLPPFPCTALEVNGITGETLLNSSRMFDVNSQGKLALPFGREMHLLEFPGPQGEWKFQSFPLVEQDNGIDPSYTCVQWNPCGEILTVCTPTLTLFDTKQGAVIDSLTTSSTATCLDWSSQTLSVGFFDGTIHTYDTRCCLTHTGTYLSNCRPSSVTTLRYSVDSGYLACGTADGKVIIWDSRNRGSPQCVLNGHNDSVGAMAWCPWKPYVATGGKAGDQTIHIWNVYTGIVNKHISTGSQVTSLAWCEQSSELVSSHGSESGEANIRVWKSPNMHLVGELGRHEGRVCHITLTADGSKLFSLGSDGILCVWDFYREATGHIPQSASNSTPTRRRSSTFTSPGKTSVMSPLALGGIR